jgi:hypothetical protein
VGSDCIHWDLSGDLGMLAEKWGAIKLAPSSNLGWSFVS